MTRVVSVDPGENTGVVLGYYDATTPLQILDRWQVHGGLAGFIAWLEEECWGLEADEWIVEKFVPEHGQPADIVGVPIEGVVALEAHRQRVPVIWQTRADKSGLIGYSDDEDTKPRRQAARFRFLERCGMYREGTENDDTNDAATHILVSLKRRRHMPTIMAFWGKGRA